jgi:hypothetical protein
LELVTLATHASFLTASKRLKIGSHANIFKKETVNSAQNVLYYILSMADRSMIQPANKAFRAK